MFLLKKDNGLYRKDYGKSSVFSAIIIIFFIMLFCIPYAVSGQTPSKHTKLSSKPLRFRVMSWNVENLFDTHHDSLKNDYEYLPEAIRHWNYTKYKKKLANIAQVITAVGEWEPPALVGLCEVENDSVLRDLTKRSPLKEMSYRYIMTNSPDIRGIDVALLYQRDLFKLISYRSISIPPFAHHRPTRDLLHVSGLLLTGDTLDVFVCHLPSRSGGAKESEPYRLHVAKILRMSTDSIYKSRLHPQLIIMGDFNDYPNNKSIKDILEATMPINENKVSPKLESSDAKSSSTLINPQKLYHMLARKAMSHSFGSYKFHGQWGLLDHFIVSGTLLNTSSRFFTCEDYANVAYLPFLLTDDQKYGDKEPLRTYKGMKYQGGISDHLPVYMDFTLIPY